MCRVFLSLKVDFPGVVTCLESLYLTAVSGYFHIAVLTVFLLKASIEGLEMASWSRPLYLSGLAEGWVLFPEGPFLGHPSDPLF